MRKLIALGMLIVGAIAVACTDQTAPTEVTNNPQMATVGGNCVAGYSENGLPNFNGFYEGLSVTNEQWTQFNNMTYIWSRNISWRCYEHNGSHFNYYVADCQRVQTRVYPWDAFSPWDWAPGAQCIYF